MTIEETYAFLDEVGKKGSILGMESVLCLCDELGNPEDYGKVIHIAGTNGKGSTGAFLRSVLIKAGYRVGHFSSPAVFDYREIFSINGKAIDDERLASLISEVRLGYERMEKKGLRLPTRFEVETVAAYLYFKEERCDFSIIEVGMGGLTDATNVVKSVLCSVFTSISLDHTEYLGSDVYEIAKIKAGIIKERCPVVCLKQDKMVNAIIRSQALKKSSKYYEADPSDYEILGYKGGKMQVLVPDYGKLLLKMTGVCQRENLALAMEVLKLLRETGHLSFLNAMEVQEGLESCFWPGRMERISNNPLIYIDGCHNADAANKLSVTIRERFPDKKIYYVTGILKDKDRDSMLKSLFPMGEMAVLVTPPNERGLAGEELFVTARDYIKKVEVASDIMEGAKMIKALAKDSDSVIIAFGSLSYLKDFKDCIKELENEE